MEQYFQNSNVDCLKMYKKRKLPLHKWHKKFNHLKSAGP